MVVTWENELPTDEELTVQEVNLSSSTLRAAAFHLGKHCEWKNNEFMLCKDETGDPRKCLKEGKDVTACSLEFFRALKKNCRQEFDQYSSCLSKSSGDFSFRYCRKTQAAYDACMLDKMKIERPDFGHFCEVRVHDSPRPAPPPPKKTLYEDATPFLPPDAPKPPAKYNSRFYWLTT